MGPPYVDQQPDHLQLGFLQHGGTLPLQEDLCGGQVARLADPPKHEWSVRSKVSVAHLPVALIFLIEVGCEICCLLCGYRTGGAAYFVRDTLAQAEGSSRLWRIGLE